MDQEITTLFFTVPIFKANPKCQEHNFLFTICFKTILPVPKIPTKIKNIVQSAMEFDMVAMLAGSAWIFNGK